VRATHQEASQRSRIRVLWFLYPVVFVASLFGLRYLGVELAIRMRLFLMASQLLVFVCRISYIVFVVSHVAATEKVADGKTANCSGRRFQGQADQVGASERE